MKQENTKQEKTFNMKIVEKMRATACPAESNGKCMMLDGVNTIRNFSSVDDLKPDKTPEEKLSEWKDNCARKCATKNINCARNR